jgi:hypothetical protein
LRYGWPIRKEEIEFAVEHYQVAVLQPWEADAMEALKSARPDMTVLAYKCLSSTRSYEPGPIFSSGVGHAAAVEAGEHWFAHRGDGSRIEWAGYPGHWQMAVWQPDYRSAWCTAVAQEFRNTRWDGVMADNDVFDDYYGLEPPLDGGIGMSDIRSALDVLVREAGERLNAVGKLLVPNIAESRREPGRWHRHAAYGGGFEEVWLAYGPDDYLDTNTVLLQAEEVRGPGLTIMRVASDGTDGHPNFTYGLAAFWIFGGGKGGAFTASAHDANSGTPFRPEQDWDLGQPTEPVQGDGSSLQRRFSNGWAAVNIADAGAEVHLDVPPGMRDADGRPAPPTVALAPHRGVLFLAD